MSNKEQIKKIREDIKKLQQQERDITAKMKKDKYADQEISKVYRKLLEMMREEGVYFEHDDWETLFCCLRKTFYDNFGQKDRGYLKHQIKEHILDQIEETEEDVKNTQAIIKVFKKYIGEELDDANKN